MTGLVRFQAVVLLLALSPPLIAAELRVPADHSTIQEAIDAATAGDIVLVARGTYRERVQLRAGIVLRSEGDDAMGTLGLQRAESTIIDGSGGDENAPGVAMAEDATLDGFTITGVGRYDEDAWNQHYATRGDEQTYDRIGKPGVAGISVIRIAHCTVRNSIVHHVGYTGIVTMGSEEMRVAPHLLNNVCYRNMGGGIGAMLHSAPVIEANTCFENFYAGIGHATQAQPLVLNNICYGNIRAGIGISENAKPVVRGNRCYHNRRAGIGCRDGAAPLLEDNDCFENGMAGIGCDGSGEVTIRHNRCLANQEAGIGIRGGGKALVMDNECRDNALVGIGLEEAASAVLTHNTCAENKTVGIALRRHSQALIHHNTLSREGGMPPMIAVLEGSSAVIRENVLSGGGVAGVLLSGEATVADNTFHGNGPRETAVPPNYAVWVQEGSRVTFTDNQVDGWRHGLLASKAERVRADGNTIRNFREAAIVITDSQLPTHATDNLALSDDETTECVRLKGPQGVVSGNIRRAPETAPTN